MAQDFQTPDWICRLMARQIPYHAKTILEPTPGAGNLVRAIKAQFPKATVYSPERFEDFNISPVDCIVANPPFTPMKRGYELLEKFFGLSQNIVILMPWLALINSQERTRHYIEKGLKRITHLPRSAFPGARVQTCILLFEQGYRGTIPFLVADPDDTEWCGCGDSLESEEDKRTGRCWICRGLE